MCSLYSFYCAKLGIMRLHGYALNQFQKEYNNPVYKDKLQELA